MYVGDIDTLTLEHVVDDPEYVTVPLPELVPHCDGDALIVRLNDGDRDVDTVGDAVPQVDIERDADVVKDGDALTDSELVLVIDNVELEQYVGDDVTDELTLFEYVDELE